MRRTAAVTGALLITAATLAACGGSSSSGDIPEIDAVAATWEEQGPQFRKDACGEKGEPVDLLTDATLEANPNEFLDDDVRAAAGWFLNSWYPYSEDMPIEAFIYVETGLELDRGLYLNAQYMDVAEVENPDEWAQVMERVESSDDRAYLGPLDPMPDPCADLYSYS